MSAIYTHTYMHILCAAATSCKFCGLNNNKLCADICAITAYSGGH